MGGARLPRTSLNWSSYAGRRCARSHLRFSLSLDVPPAFHLCICSDITSSTLQFARESFPVCLPKPLWFYRFFLQRGWYVGCSCPMIVCEDCLLKGTQMSDLIFIAVTLVFFAIAWAYTRGCERL